MSRALQCFLRFVIPLARIPIPSTTATLFLVAAGRFAVIIVSLVSTLYVCSTPFPLAAHSPPLLLLLYLLYSLDCVLLSCGPGWHTLCCIGVCVSWPSVCALVERPDTIRPKRWSRLARARYRIRSLAWVCGAGAWLNCRDEMFWSSRPWLSPDVGRACVAYVLWALSRSSLPTSALSISLPTSPVYLRFRPLILYSPPLSTWRIRWAVFVCATCPCVRNPWLCQG